MRTLQSIFEEQVARTPHAVALDFEGHLLTYQQLNARTNQLARYLAKKGVDVEVPVGLCMERSLDFVAAVLAIMKAGGIYLPLDPAHPADRLMLMTRDVEPRVLLTNGRRHAIPLSGGCCAINLDEDGYAISQEATENPPVPVGPKNCLYIIFTSGSTGRPKGVMGTHQGLVNRLAWSWEHYPFREEEVCCQKTSCSFVDSIAELFAPLLAGVPSVVIPDTTVKNVAEMIVLLREKQVTRIVLTPSLLREFLQGSNNLGAVLPRLRIWVSSGEVLPPQLVSAFREALPGAVLLNLYGSSETAADSTFCEMTNPASPPSSIGKAMNRVTAYVLDQQMRVLPCGETGDLYIGGAGLARGYWKRPELTATRFVADPFSEQPGSRLYRTGDLACLSESGDLIFKGRSDRQVKIRGCRVELGEIEAVLQDHTHVQQAVVTLWEQEPGPQRLAAYVVLRNGSQDTAIELRNFLKAKLPGYMVPATVMILSRFPLTPHGKVDREALLNTEKIDYTAPRNHLEEVLSGIWKEVLEIKRTAIGMHRKIGIHENFFELGGDSLACTRVAAWAKAAGIRLSVDQMFQNPTIAEQANSAQADNIYHSDENGSMLVPLRSKGTKPPLFFIHPEGGGIDFLWPLIRRLDADQPVYAIRAAGLGAGQIQERELEEMAADYVALIRKAQPEGPYLLGGYSFGVHVAFLCARLLYPEVQLLAQIDDGPAVSANPAQNEVDFLIWFGKEYGNLDLQKQELLRQPDKMQLALVLQKLEPEMDALSFAHISRMAPVRYAHEKALQKYLSRVRRSESEYQYCGRITLFKTKAEGNDCSSEGETGSEAEFTAGWSGLSPQRVEVHSIAGTHATCLLEPHVQDLARKLERAIRQSSAANGLLPYKADATLSCSAK